MDISVVEDNVRNGRGRDVYVEIQLYDKHGIVLLGATVAGILLFLCYHAIIRWRAAR